MSRGLPGVVFVALLVAARTWALECTVGGFCVLGICTPGTAVVCADGDPCTVAVCDPLRGCVQSPATGGVCDDGDPCTLDDRCVAGQCVGRPLHCTPDAWSCTDEVCVDGVCRAAPVDERCGSDECSTGACRPHDRAADRRGCVAIPAPDGLPCADDGVACTDDICDAAICLHVPIDSRCTGASECRVAACAPERADRDADGCIDGASPPSADPPVCAEDGDACSDDRCVADTCRHDAVADVARCAPVRAAFRRALALAALARGLRTEHARATAADGRGGNVATAVASRLERGENELRQAVEILGGRGHEARSEPTARQFDETVAERRARLALRAVRRAALHFRAVVHAARSAPVRGALGRQRCATLRRDCQTLVRGVQALASALRHVQHRTASFAR